LRSHGDFTSFALSQYVSIIYQQILRVSLGKIAGVTFSACWCAERAGKHSLKQVGVTSAVTPEMSINQINQKNQLRDAASHPYVECALAQAWQEGHPHGWAICTG